MYREASSRRPTVTIALKPWPLDFPPPFFLEPLRWFLGSATRLGGTLLSGVSQFLVTASGALVQILYDAMAVII